MWCFVKFICILFILERCTKQLETWHLLQYRHTWIMMKWLVVDVGCKTQRNETGELSTDYLIKWEGLPYSCSTEEDGLLIDRLFPKAVDEYHSRLRSACTPNKLCRVLNILFILLIFVCTTEVLELFYCSMCSEQEVWIMYNYSMQLYMKARISPVLFTTYFPCLSSYFAAKPDKPMCYYYCCVEWQKFSSAWGDPDVT